MKTIGSLVLKLAWWSLTAMGLVSVFYLVYRVAEAKLDEYGLTGSDEEDCGSDFPY